MPVYKEVPIIPSDVKDIDITEAIRIDAVGKVTMMLEGDTEPRLYDSLPIGDYPYNVRRIMSTGTNPSIKLTALY